MWRCWECGEMGRIEGADLPSACPDCGAPREELYYWAED
jgi:rubrerythrin